MLSVITHIFTAHILIKIHFGQRYQLFAREIPMRLYIIRMAQAICGTLNPDRNSLIYRKFMPQEFILSTSIHTYVHIYTNGIIVRSCQYAFGI